jgi:hypothetical protein
MTGESAGGDLDILNLHFPPRDGWKKTGKREDGVESFLFRSELVRGNNYSSGAIRECLINLSTYNAQIQSGSWLRQAFC